MGRMIIFALVIGIVFLILKAIRDYKLSKIKKDLTNVPSYTPEIEVLVGFSGDKESEQVAKEIMTLLISNGVKTEITLIDSITPKLIAEESADSQVQIFVKGNTHEL